MAPQSQVPWSWRRHKATQANETMTQYKAEDVAKLSVLELANNDAFYP